AGTRAVSRSLIVVLAVGFALRSSGRRRASHGFLPVVLHGGGELFDAREERGNFPHFLFGKGFAPGGHAGVADAGAKGIVNVPLGIIHWMQDQLRNRRVKGFLERAWLVIETSMTPGTIHGVDFHSFNQVLVGGWNGAGIARGVP